MSENSPRDLGPEQLLCYEQQGALLLRGAFEGWVGTLEAGAALNLERPGEFATESTRAGEQGRFLDDYCNWRTIHPYEDFARTSGCAKLAAQAMGSNTARFFHEHLILKTAGTEHATPLHHDLPYYPLQGQQMVSVWIALDSIPQQHTMELIAGSHRNPTLFAPRAFRDGRAYEDASSEFEVLESDEPQAAERLSWSVEPGDAILFHFRTLHGSSALPLASRRLAIAFRWLGDDVRWLNRSGRTSPPFPHLELEDGAPLPDQEFPVLYPHDQA